ncbi:MAG TPA: ATP-binding protein [Fluviicoccus sp.]|nr:ATP-binding protein [Fluviicoccus sp.]
MPDRSLPFHSPLAVLIGLRWLAIAGQSLAVGVVHARLDMPVPLQPLFLILLGQVLFNLASMWALIRSRPGSIREDHLALQFIFDTLALAAMLYFTGGAYNPFASLFLVPLAIAAVMLPLAYTCALVILTVFLYRSLMDNSIPLPEPPPGLVSSLSLHMAGMWINFILSACLIAGFVCFLAQRLRASSRELRDMRELNLRQEQILALGVLAAGTAHELGTPLATMAVVTADLEQDVPEPLKEDVRLLQQQIGICKDTLARLVEEVRHGRAETETVTTTEFVRRVLRHFDLLRPAVRVDAGDGALGVRTCLAVNRQLEQAILNFLNNAADVSPDDVTLRVEERDGRVMLEISDRGPGFSPLMLREAGSRIAPPQDDENGGMGIGLLLSNATIESHGGEVRVSLREGGGSRVRVILPGLTETNDG